MFFFSFAGSAQNPNDAKHMLMHRGKESLGTYDLFTQGGEMDLTARRLPCAHAFHTTCIDQWLLVSQRDKPRTCPMCKRNPVAIPCGKAGDNSMRVESLSQFNDFSFKADGGMLEPQHVVIVLAWM